MPQSSSWKTNMKYDALTILHNIWHFFLKKLRATSFLLYFGSHFCLESSICGGGGGGVGHKSSQTDRRVDSEEVSQKDRQICRQAHRQADRQPDRPTDKLDPICYGSMVRHPEGHRGCSEITQSNWIYWHRKVLCNWLICVSTQFIPVSPSLFSRCWCLNRHQHCLFFF